MGCGQSHIAVIYPRKSKAKGSPPSGGASDESEEERAPPAETTLVEETQPSSGKEDEEAASERIRQMVKLNSSPLLSQAELSSSQSDFFKMLDDKIESGPDYESVNEYEFAMDHAQLSRFIQDWQAAKQRSKYGINKPLQRYHSMQSNGDTGIVRHKLQHQMSYTAPQMPQHYPYQYDQHPIRQYQPMPQMQPLPPSHQYQYPPGPPQPQFHHPYHPNVANSVVMYDNNRGAYFTELA